MDLIFIAGIAGLWGLLALMVWGLKKLETSDGSRP
jgi:hypothetical protein